MISSRKREETRVYLAMQKFVWETPWVSYTWNFPSFMVSLLTQRDKNSL